MSATFQNSAMVLSIGIFFSLIILGRAGSLPRALTHGLVAQGVPHADAARVGALPAVSIMFAALLGYNPVQTLARPRPDQAAGQSRRLPDRAPFFPSLISAPFEHGLTIAFDFAIAACLVAAVASVLRGRKYVHGMAGSKTRARQAPVKLTQRARSVASAMLNPAPAAPGELAEDQEPVISAAGPARAGAGRAPVIVRPGRARPGTAGPR